MEPKTILGQNDLAKKWKDALERILPNSIVEIHEEIKESKLFTCFFTTELGSGFKQSVQMFFFKNGNVTAETQSGVTLEELKSFEEAETWILEYFNVPTKLLPEPEKILAGLPKLEERKESYQKWSELLEKLKPYGVEVDIENEHRPFSLYLPTLESVMRNDGNFESNYDNAVYLDQGEDWAQIIKEEVIPKLKKIYDLSLSEIPDFSEDLKMLKLSEKQKKMHPAMNPWIEYFQELKENVPFNMMCHDIWSSIGTEGCYFNADDGKIYSGLVGGVYENKKNGILSIPFEWSCLFNINTIPVRIFSGKITFFERNTAVLEFSGTSIWGKRFVQEDFQYHLQGRYAGAKGHNNCDIEIEKIFLSSTWLEVTNKFNELVQTIINLFGKAMEIQPEIMRSHSQRG